jgi:rhombotail lipoprotein
MKRSLALLSILLVLGCATPETVQHRSSLASYLGAKSATPPDDPERPVRLQLPLRLGIAFVPGGPGQRQGSLLGTGAPSPLGASQEQELHQRVSALFEAKPWTQSFKVIPSQYLAKDGGFDDLAKVARAFHVDVVALVSVDQIQFSQPRWYAWTYWTLVGAYMVKGDANDTTTLVDAAVYHVPSRTFLFRAGATGTLKGGSSWSQREDAFRHQAQESLKLAMDNLSGALDQGVVGFKQDLLKGARRDVILVDPQGHPLGSADYDPTRR